MGFNIAIDGPAGAGKSTIAKELAKRLGFIYVDTGAMYRAMALYLIQNGLDGTDSEKVEAICQQAEISIAYENGQQVVCLNGENVNGLIRAEEVGNMASTVSAYGKVREKLVELQQKLAESRSVVMDGRDIGTCVLPLADVKVFLTATSRVRAVRRYEELKEKGEVRGLEEIEADIIQRDKKDMEREISPLRQAEDAVLIDSSDMTVEEVLGTIMELVCKKERNKRWK